MQEVVVALILVACVLFTARRLWRRFHAAASCGCRTADDDCGCRHDGMNPSNIYCAGCPLADKCSNKHQL